ncbi:MAG: M20/M25/M40 family metallo-hydrolase [Pyrinomonadaceae bacterium]
MHRRLLNLSLIIIAALGVALAQQPNNPSVERLRAHISFLASDKLEGRRTGTMGANTAAEYIAREFARYGLRRSIGYDTPGMSILEADSPKRYMQEFPYVAGVELGKANELSFKERSATTPTTLRVGPDWMPLGFSSNGRMDSTGVVFVGYGITDSELKYNDYPPAVKGRIAVAISGTPDGNNAHGGFSRYGEARWKAIAAHNAGAKALLIISQEENLLSDPRSRLRYDNSATEAGLSVAIISRLSAARLFGTQDSHKVTELETMFRTIIDEQLKKEVNAYGLSGLPDLTKIPVSDYPVTFSTDVVRRQVPAYNVVGILDGSDSELAKEAIVIGAHYDHLGRGGEGSLASREGDIHHGADDNASGVAGMLELARLFTSDGQRPRRTIVFMAYGGEEEGLLGSNYYVNHPVIRLANTVAMINMDMIGRMKNSKLIIGGVGTAKEWREMISTENYMQSITVNPSAKPDDVRPRSSVPIVVSANGSAVISVDAAKAFDIALNQDGFGPSDHSSFYARQIPVLFFWTGTHEDYHKPSDTAYKINYEDEARILSFAFRLIRNVDRNDERPSYLVTKSESTGRSTGFRVYLGTIPNYSDSNDGLLLDGVRDDSPAAKAGLKAGDKIVKLAGRDVGNVYDYTYALGEMKGGQEYEVEVLRGGQRLKLKITPAPRR